MTGAGTLLSKVEREQALRLVHAGLEEDLAQGGDRTSEALVGEGSRGTAALVARGRGVVAGLAVAEMVFRAVDTEVIWRENVRDGVAVEAGRRLATVQGRVRSLLAAERTALNFLGYLSGIATLTRRYVDAVAGTDARIFDTRKTLPSWRALVKYAVRAGGAMNHRMSLGDALLIKDNHLAALAAELPGAQKRDVLSVAVQRAKEQNAGVPVIVEVDDLEQLRRVLPLRPDVVLLDNLAPAALAEGVALRNEIAPAVALEASGGITLANVRAVAETGVERISIGALTHSAAALDIGMDWVEESGS